MYYQNDCPLNQPDLTPEQKKELEPRIIGSQRPIKKRNQEVELRYYFTEVREDNIISYDAVLNIDIYVPEDLLRVYVPHVSFFGLVTGEKKAYRNYVIGDYIEKSLTLLGYRNIGKPKLDRSDQRKGEEMAKITITAKVDIVK
ncbi:hypothetical protein [Thermoactinomyces sp. DSM 45892]|uniref:hypothetical protein n=1 Tax=Thermoactinomyces sp. DSM 45892 TaxID=1882753 RepID=UPI0008966A61|nr:hypothetical protein [Thermoactinomyces sp. DSM 45892]SDY85061.1 hypothetical protein SAMN05444416_10970 [Thermoactinomyces sp. DSM 45892]